MKKLINLLNTYEKEIKKSKFYEWEKGIGGATKLFRRDTRDDEGSHIYSETADTYVISKKYEFIKWLVENDKIDTSKANDKNLNGYEIELRIRAAKELVADSEEKTVLYLNLLMLLSISDTPIEDLISYLK